MESDTIQRSKSIPDIPQTVYRVGAATGSGPHPPSVGYLRSRTHVRRLTATGTGKGSSAGSPTANDTRCGTYTPHQSVGLIMIRAPHCGPP